MLNQAKFAFEVVVFLCLFFGGALLKSFETFWIFVLFGFHCNCLVPPISWEVESDVSTLRVSSSQ